MTAALVITTLATLMWCYAAVLAAIWVRAVSRRERREHVGHFVSLMGVFVPGIGLSVAVVLVGVTVGVPAIVPGIAVLFPGAVATGLQLEVNALTDADARTEALRVACAVVLAAAVIARG